MEKNQLKLFESKNVVADVAAIANSCTTYKFAETPTALFKLEQMSDTWITTYRTLLKQNAAHFIKICEDRFRYPKQVGVGVTLVDFQLSGYRSRTKSLVFSLTTSRSAEHLTPYDNYGIEFASKEIEYIKIKNLPTDRYPNGILYINLDDTTGTYVEKKEIYTNYMQDAIGTVRTDVSNFVNYQHLWQYHTMKKYYSKAGSTLGQKIIVDLTPSKNSATLPDKSIISSDVNLEISVKLKSSPTAATNKWELSVTNIVDKAYMMIDPRQVENGEKTFPSLNIRQFEKCKQPVIAEVFTF